MHMEFHSAFRRGESGVCGDMRHLPSLRLRQGGRTQGGDLQDHTSQGLLKQRTGVVAGVLGGREMLTGYGAVVL